MVLALSWCFSVPPLFSFISPSCLSHLFALQATFPSLTFPFFSSKPCAYNTHPYHCFLFSSCTTNLTASLNAQLLQQHLLSSWQPVPPARQPEGPSGFPASSFLCPAGVKHLFSNKCVNAVYPGQCWLLGGGRGIAVWDELWQMHQRSTEGP